MFSQVMYVRKCEFDKSTLMPQVTLAKPLQPSCGYMEVGNKLKTELRLVKHAIKTYIILRVWFQKSYPFFKKKKEDIFQKIDQIN